ncbi:253_t:CDS:2, partial [Ambispora leptoticha]
ASLVDSASDSESITDCLQEKSDEISNVASDISSNTDDIVGNGITIKITTDDAVIVSADATDDRQNKSNDGAVSIDDEARAFKSQFDEISNITRMLENAKTNNNNRYYGSPGRVHPGFSSPNYLLPQRRMN